MSKNERSNSLSRLITILLAVLFVSFLGACQPVEQPTEDASAASATTSADVKAATEAEATTEADAKATTEAEANPANNSGLAEADLKEFLTIFFTSDYEGRYTAFAANQDADTYYALLKDLITDECLDTLMRNREPLKYEKKLTEEESSVRFKNYEAEKSEADFWEGTVALEETKADGSTEELTYKVQLSLSQVEGKTLINSVYFR
ncbi:MAG: hypothetical protein Q4E09_05565 [Eubacteriales bacterium]|nr:hypothetical protein [Eubacteriales bacterium]